MKNTKSAFTTRKFAALFLAACILPVTFATTVAQDADSQKRKLAAADFIKRGDDRDERKKYDEAIDFYSKAIELDTKNALVYSKRGWCHYQKADYDKAIGDFTKSIELDPKSADYYLDRAYAYWKGNRDRTKAMADCNKAVAIDPKNAKAYFYRALVYHSYETQQNFDKAIDDLNKALEIDPNYTDAIIPLLIAKGAKKTHEIGESVLGRTVYRIFHATISSQSWNDSEEKQEP